MRSLSREKIECRLSDSSDTQLREIESSYLYEDDGRHLSACDYPRQRRDWTKSEEERCDYVAEHGCVTRSFQTLCRKARVRCRDASAFRMV
jgi:hypothetical protein